MKVTSSKRIKIDGKWWTVRIARPPGRETLDGLCDADTRTIYLHPKAIPRRSVELICHEVVHARLFDLDEECVDEIGRVVGEIHLWLLNRAIKIQKKKHK